MLKLQVGECYRIQVRKNSTILKDMQDNTVKNYKDLVELYTDIHENKYTYRNKDGWCIEIAGGFRR